MRGGQDAQRVVLGAHLHRGHNSRVGGLDHGGIQGSPFGATGSEAEEGGNPDGEPGEARPCRHPAIGLG